MSSLKFNNVYINNSYTVAGPLESKGLIKKFDCKMKDYYFGEKTFEQAEIKMQKTVIDNLLKKNNLKDKDVNCLIGGDLSNQLTATGYNAKNYDISFLGVYNACASYPESLIILANLIESNQMQNGIIITSSHNLTSEKQFRFPVEYGAPKPDFTTFTATGSVGNILSNKKSSLKVESATIGKVIDFGIKDAQNMGAVMAPAAAEVLVKHLKDLKRNYDYYDLILTGDLGSIGCKILKEFLNKTTKINLTNHVDAGCEIYKEDQRTCAGASGPVSLPLVLWNKVFHNPQIKKVLIIGTGSLHSPVMVNQKLSIPAIAHAVSLEVL